MAKKFNVPLSSAGRGRSRAADAGRRREMALDELRASRDMTQVRLAKILGVNQAAVSKLERRGDVHLSTLQDFVKALGGKLKISAEFPEGKVEIKQLKQGRKD
jgi:transcriptional regulator with XRE-family HTH domain